jgi:TetR/AcrR family transcriptional regulator
MADHSLKRHRHPDATREALIRAATELFALRGFDGVTIDEIATKAGANKALISYYFRGKRGLYTAILQSTMEVAVARLRALAESPRSPADLLRDFIASFHQMATVDRPHFPALVLREVVTSGKTFNDTIAPQIIALLQSIRAIIERGVREGVFRPVDPLLAHLSIIGSLLFFYATEPPRRRLAAEGRLPVPLPSPDEFVRHIQEMVIRGLARDGFDKNTMTGDGGEQR